MKSILAGQTLDGVPGVPPNAQTLSFQQAETIWAVGMYCIFCWEWLINLPAEIKHIWRKQLSLVSILYLANRYFGLFQFSIAMSLLTSVWHGKACDTMHRWNPVAAIFSMLFSQLIMTMRVYAVWNRNKLIACILSVLMLAGVAVAIVAVTTVAPVQNTCFAVFVSLPWMSASWIIPLVFDFVTFVLTVVKTWQLSRGNTQIPLVQLLLRDGLIYFAVIYTMNMINVIFFFTVPVTLRPVNIGPTIMLTVLITCRLALNLRKFSPKQEQGIRMKSFMESFTIPVESTATSNSQVFSTASFAAQFDRGEKIHELV